MIHCEEFENIYPMITKNIRVKEKCPWFNADIITARKKEGPQKRNGKEERQEKIKQIILTK